MKKKRWLIVTLIILAVILLLVALAAAAVVIYANQKVNLMPRVTGTVAPPSPSEMIEFSIANTEAPDPSFTGPVYEPEEITWPTLPDVPLEESAEVVNILLVGSDYSFGGRARSDAMILCTLNQKDKTVTLTSLMRDMYVKIPGYAANRINASYFFGGLPLLNQCIEENFGVVIDGNFLVDFDSFKSVVDLVGGVDIALNQAEVNYMNAEKNWTSDTKYLAGTFVVGTNCLNGDAALAYARNRTVGMWDFERTQRQRNVLMAVFNKCKKMSIAQLDELLNQLLPMVTTDMENSQIWDLTKTVIPMLSGLSVKTNRLPADGSYQNAWVSGMSVLIPDLEENRQILFEIMN